MSGAPPAPERLDIEDADLRLWRRVPIEPSPGQAMATLLADTCWREEEVFVWGRWHRQPRLTASVGDPGAVYTYAARRLEPMPWSPLLRALRDRVEDYAGARFNSVLLNLYRDGRDRMGFHSDDEPELGREPVIASLSLGAPRTMKFRHRTRRDLGTIPVILDDASLLVMRGATQRCWKHGIDAEPKIAAPRINLTFRLVSVAA